jgi:hypothetical protein
MVIMSKIIELSTLAIEMFVVLVLLMYKNVSAEHGDMVYHIQLYHHEGSPSLQRPLVSDTTDVGTNDTIVAKIFDVRNVWLPEYEKPDSGRMYIHWKVEAEFEDELTESNLLSDTVGCIVIVNSQRAYRNYKIIVSFKGGSIDTAFLFIKPVCRPLNLTIQTEKRWIYSGRIDTLHLSNFITPLYAVVLDQFDNFVRYANDAVWSSSDTTSIVITNGDTSTGECILTVNAETFKNTKVILQSMKNSSGDTIIVVNNFVTTALTKDQNSTVLSEPVFYVDKDKLRIQFPFAAHRIVRFYSLSGNFVNSLMTNDACCSVVLRPGMYIFTAGIAGMGHLTSNRVLVSR